MAVNETAKGISESDINPHGAVMVYDVDRQASRYVGDASFADLQAMAKLWLMLPMMEACIEALSGLSAVKANAFVSSQLTIILDQLHEINGGNEL